MEIQQDRERKLSKKKKKKIRRDYSSVAVLYGTPNEKYDHQEIGEFC